MENVIYNVALTGLMAGKRRSEKEILLVVIWQEVFESRRYERQIRITNNGEVKGVLEELRKTEEEHKHDALEKLTKLEPGFVLNERELPEGKMSGIFLLDEKEFFFEEKKLDLNAAKDVRLLLNVIDTDAKREAYVARLYSALSMDTKSADTKEMLEEFIADENLHLAKLKGLGERVKLLYGSLLGGGE